MPGDRSRACRRCLARIPCQCPSSCCCCCCCPHQSQRTACKRAPQRESPGLDVWWTHARRDAHREKETTDAGQQPGSILALMLAPSDRAAPLPLSLHVCVRMDAAHALEISYTLLYRLTRIIDHQQLYTRRRGTANAQITVYIYI